MDLNVIEWELTGVVVDGAKLIRMVEPRIKLAANRMPTTKSVKASRRPLLINFPEALKGVLLAPGCEVP